ncbi:hypothetical protein [Aurantivibrio plasticivorans]
MEKLAIIFLLFMSVNTVAQNDDLELPNSTNTNAINTPETPAPTISTTKSKTQSPATPSVETQRKIEPPSITFDLSERQLQTLDLHAQQSMSLYTMRIFWASAIQVIASVGGLIFVFYTLKATKESADAAQAAVAGQGAWVLIREKSNEGWLKWGNGSTVTKYFCITLQIVNEGETPATNISHKWGYRFFAERDLEDRDAIPNIDTPNQSLSGTITRNSNNLIRIPLTDKEFERACTTTGENLVIRVVTTYWTVHGEKRQTDESFIYQLKNPPGKQTKSSNNIYENMSATIRMTMKRISTHDS